MILKLEIAISDYPDDLTDEEFTQLAKDVEVVIAKGLELGSYQQVDLFASLLHESMVEDAEEEGAKKPYVEKDLDDFKCACPSENANDGVAGVYCVMCGGAR